MQELVAVLGQVVFELAIGLFGQGEQWQQIHRGIVEYEERYGHVRGVQQSADGLRYGGVPVELVIFMELLGFVLDT